MKRIITILAIVTLALLFGRAWAEEFKVGDRVRTTHEHDHGLKPIRGVIISLETRDNATPLATVCVSGKYDPEYIDTSWLEKERHSVCPGKKWDCPDCLEPEPKCRTDAVMVRAWKVVGLLQTDPNWKIVGSAEIENEFIGNFRRRRYDTYVWLKREICEEIK